MLDNNTCISCKFFIIKENTNIYTCAYHDCVVEFDDRICKSYEKCKKR